VSLWPMFYAQQIGYYPSLVHARLMIQAFGGAFVIGFLGTAGPRMASAPALTPIELVWLFSLHQASALSHLCLRPWLGDALFAVLVGSLLLSLLVRMLTWGRDSPPPHWPLTATGLLCGVAGSTLLLLPDTTASAGRLRLAHLLLYQGLLLPPVLGIGSFFFPRLLGGAFGEPASTSERDRRFRRALVAAIIIVASFFLEAAGQARTGLLLRLAVATAYLIIEVRWRRHPDDGPRGSFATGLLWSLALGGLGLALAATRYPQHISIEHLLYIGGFGMLMLIVGSRVLFGHSGTLEQFSRPSWPARCLIILGILAATTRATPAWAPSTTISHHIYAALTWAALALGWLIWHHRRFVSRDPNDDHPPPIVGEK